MGVLFTVLKIIGLVLLWVLAIVLVLLLLVLLVPLRYRWKGRIDDPIPRDSIDADALKEELRGRVQLSWLLNFVQAEAVWPSGEILSVRIMGIRLPVEKILSRKKQEEKPPEEEKKPAEKKSLKQILEELPAKAEQIRAKAEQAKAKADSALRILEKPATGEALRCVLEKILNALKHYVPRNWHLNGILGLGDPAASAGVLQVCGFLYPVTEGRLRLDTDFMAWRFDLDTAGEGHVRLIHLVTAAVRILLDRNVRKLIGCILKLRKRNRIQKGAENVAA